MAQEPQNEVNPRRVGRASGSEDRDGGVGDQFAWPSRDVRAPASGRSRLSATAPVSLGVDVPFVVSRSRGVGAYGLAPAPFGVSTPFGTSPRDLAFRPPPQREAATSFGRRPPWASDLPFGDSADRTPPHRACPEGPLSGGAASLGLLVPYDTCRPGGPAYGWRSLSSRVPRAGFGHPLRDVHPRAFRHLHALASAAHPCGCLVPKRPWDSPFKAIPPSWSVLLSESLPSWRQARRSATRSRWPCATPFRAAAGVLASRASFPRRIRSVTAPVCAGRRCLLGVLPSRACSPPRWRRLSFAGTSPLVLARVDVSSRVGLRVSSDGGVGRSVSGPPALLGFMAS